MTRASGCTTSLSCSSLLLSRTTTRYSILGTLRALQPGCAPGHAERCCLSDSRINSRVGPSAAHVSLPDSRAGDHTLCPTPWSVANSYTAVHEQHSSSHSGHSPVVPPLDQITLHCTAGLRACVRPALATGSTTCMCARWVQSRCHQLAGPSTVCRPSAPVAVLR